MEIVRDRAAPPATAAEPRALAPFNRKFTEPSLLMHAPDGQRYRCAWIEDSITIHSDGNVTCGLDDPHGQRSFGNINRQSVAGIFANPEYARLRQKLWDGHRCTECNLYQRVPDNEADEMPERPVLPGTAVVEPTVRCNIRCPNSACIANNDPKTRTRDADMLGLDPFRRVAEELAGRLRHVYFFNYGDPFVHAQAEDMLAHLRRTSPEARVVTSTNGIPLAKPERARKVVESGLEFIVFTIGGITQESYSRYHVAGRADLALRGLANVLQAKRELGASNPVVHWRYLLFNWNDGDAEIEAALRLVEEHGVDEFCLYLTHVPDGAASFRFSPGSPNFSRYRRYISNSLHYTNVVPAPDRNGFYALEQTALGPARWTGWQARRRLRVDGHRARLAVTTSRPAASERANHVFVVTPWQKVKVPLEPMAWRVVELAIPDHLRPDALEVELVTFDHWFPAEELGSTDLRCLGVLVREDEAGPAGDEPPWPGSAALTAEEEVRLAAFRYAAPLPLVDDNGGRLARLDEEP